MDTHYCNPKTCDRKETCNHHTVKPFRGKRIAQDMSDICLPHYRLYIEGDYYGAFPMKEYYIELLSFYDNECCKEGCGYKEPYSNKPFVGSRIDCKFGKEFTCKHPDHPDNKAARLGLEYLMAEDKAFEDANIKEGTVTFICPICGGEAVGHRYEDSGRIHGLGSGCRKCGIKHT